MIYKKSSISGQRVIYREACTYSWLRLKSHKFLCHMISQNLEPRGLFHKIVKREVEVGTLKIHSCGIGTCWEMIRLLIGYWIDLLNSSKPDVRREFDKRWWISCRCLIFSSCGRCNSRKMERQHTFPIASHKSLQEKMSYIYIFHDNSGGDLNAFSSVKNMYACYCLED